LHEKSFLTFKTINIFQKIPVSAAMRIMTLKADKFILFHLVGLCLFDICLIFSVMTGKAKRFFSFSDKGFCLALVDIMAYNTIQGSRAVNIRKICFYVCMAFQAHIPGRYYHVIGGSEPMAKGAFV
jgi:hypothetical protein